MPCENVTAFHNLFAWLSVRNTEFGTVILIQIFPAGFFYFGSNCTCQHARNRSPETFPWLYTYMYKCIQIHKHTYTNACIYRIPHFLCRLLWRKLYIAGGHICFTIRKDVYDGEEYDYRKKFEELERKGKWLELRNYVDQYIHEAKNPAEIQKTCHILCYQVLRNE